MTLQERKANLEAELAEVNRQLEGYSRALPTNGGNWYIDGDGGDFRVLKSARVDDWQRESGNAFATEEEAERHLAMMLDIPNPRKRENGWGWSAVSSWPYPVAFCNDSHYWFRYNTSGIWATKEEAEAKGPAWAARWCQK